MTFHPGFGTTDRMETLASCAGGLIDHLQSLAAPVGRHLTSGTRGLVPRRCGRLQHLHWGQPQLKHQGSITVVGEKPILARFQYHAKGGVDRLVTTTIDLEEDLPLSLETDLFIIHLSTEEHVPIHRQQLPNLETLDPRLLFAVLPRTASRVSGLGALSGHIDPDLVEPICEDEFWGLREPVMVPIALILEGRGTSFNETAGFPHRWMAEGFSGYRLALYPRIQRR